MTPFPFDPENDKELFKLDEETLKQIEDSYGNATIDYISGYRDGYKMGAEQSYEDGLEIGWYRGRDDIIHQLKRYSQNTYDSDLEKAIEDIVGD